MDVGTIFGAEDVHVELLVWEYDTRQGYCDTLLSKVGVNFACKQVVKALHECHDAKGILRLVVKQVQKFETGSELGLGHREPQACVRVRAVRRKVHGNLWAR